MDATQPVVAPPRAPSYHHQFHSPGGITVAYTEEWTKRHVMEGDGLCPLLYHHLHKNIKGREHSLSSVLLPDTVVFDHSFPRAWYTYDTENKEIAKRPGRMLDAQTMYAHFSKEEKGCDIVAQFYHATTHLEEEWHTLFNSASGKETAGQPYEGRLLTYVEFFTADGLRRFLFEQHRKPDGVLQKFVLSQGSGNSRRNAQLQVVWSPLLTTVYRRTNHCRLDDRGVPLSVRASTYDGPLYYSDEVVVADETKARLDRLCRDIADHFHATEKKHLSRLQVYFKTDDDNRMWLLWCGGVRVAADSLNPSHLRVPVALDMRMEICNAGMSSVEQLARRRLREKQLLALDYELFQASRDLEFAMVVNASHARQARALDLPGLQSTPPRPSQPESGGGEGGAGGAVDPRYDPHHPLHDAFLNVCDEGDTPVSVQDLGRRSPSAAAARGSRLSSDGDEASAASRLRPIAARISDIPMEARVQEELTALAMDAWYAVYSTTLAEDPRVMPTAKVRLADPLIGALHPEELRVLTELLGLLPEKGDNADPCQYMVAPYLVTSGRRRDRPSTQVEKEVIQFFQELWRRRGKEVVQYCLEQKGDFFD